MIAPVSAGQASPHATPARWRTPLLVAATLLGGVAIVSLATGWWPGPGDAPWATPHTTFQVVDHDTGEVVFEHEIEVGSRFVLDHVHSVTERPVRERFLVADASTLHLEELVFDEFGPNLPAGPEHVAENGSFQRDGDVYRVTYEDHAIGTVPLMVGSATVDHRVALDDGRQLRLLEVTRSGARVELRVSGG